MIFKTCPYCGANLDPEEICDCPQGRYDYARELVDNYIVDSGSGSTLKPTPGLEKEVMFGPGTKEPLKRNNKKEQYKRRQEKDFKF